MHLSWQGKGGKGGGLLNEKRLFGEREIWGSGCASKTRPPHAPMGFITMKGRRLVLYKAGCSLDPHGSEYLDAPPFSLGGPGFGALHL